MKADIELAHRLEDCAAVLRDNFPRFTVDTPTRKIELETLLDEAAERLKHPANAE